MRTKRYHLNVFPFSLVLILIWIGCVFKDDKRLFDVYEQTNEDQDELVAAI